MHAPEFLLELGALILKANAHSGEVKSGERNKNIYMHQSLFCALILKANAREGWG